jgi:hypothetical protein
MKQTLEFERSHKNRYTCSVKISIIVPAFNEEKVLGETLAQIKSASSALRKPARKVN